MTAAQSYTSLKEDEVNALRKEVKRLREENARLRGEAPKKHPHPGQLSIPGTEDA